MNAKELFESNPDLVERAARFAERHRRMIRFPAELLKAVEAEAADAESFLRGNSLVGLIPKPPVSKRGGA